MQRLMQHLMHFDATPDAATNSALMHPLMQQLMHPDAAPDAATNAALMQNQKNNHKT